MYTSADEQKTQSPSGSSQPTIDPYRTGLEDLSEKDCLRILSLSDQELLPELDTLVQVYLSKAESWRTVMRVLIRCIRERGVLPPNLLLSGVERRGSEPVWGGSFSDVWRGTFQEQPVAVKVLRIFAAQEPQKLKQALGCEALIWRKLKHKNVQPFLGIGVCGTGSNQLYSLVTPWMEEGHLMEYLSNHPSSSRTEMIKGIASGLHYLHSEGIVHGDVRGENVLVDETGCPRITDFGLSRLRSTHGKRSSTDSIKGGVLRFQAPELVWPESFQGEGAEYCNGELTTKSDIYALAITCIQIFIGKPPFSGLPDHKILFGVVSENLRPERPRGKFEEPNSERSKGKLKEPDEEPDDDLWALIQQAWARHPKDRPDMATFCRKLG